MGIGKHWSTFPPPHIRANLGRFTTLNAGGLDILETRMVLKLNVGRTERRLIGQMEPSLDDRGSHDPLDLIDRLDCGSLSRMRLLALACCSADFAFDLAGI